VANVRDERALQRRCAPRAVCGDANGDDTTTTAPTIDQLDFVGELNGSSNLSNDSTSITNDGGGGGGGVSFGENEVRTFEMDASERKNEYMTQDDGDGDGDGDDEGDSGRLKIGGDIRLDTLDIHTLNDIQELNAPPLLDDIEVLA
jgi:hypothetical protein